MRRGLAPATSVLALATLALTACSVAAPRPWEKDLLAREAMTMDGDVLEQRHAAHIYTSRENSSGGAGVGGGGCGCN